jgi:hypothetical protein
MGSRGVSRREIRDLWYHVARMRMAKGDIEGARRARISARIMDGNNLVVSPRVRRPTAMRDASPSDGVDQ